MKPITFAYCYYDDPDMLQTQVNWWSRYRHPEIDMIRFVIVDDGSQRHPAADVLRGSEKIVSALDLDLYIVDVDLPWNQCGARNLGVHVSDTDWVWCCDIDHVVTRRLACEMLRRIETPSARWYTAPRERADTQTILAPAPNLYLIRRSDYWLCGGNDEDLQGGYIQDRLWRHTARVLGPQGALANSLIVYPRPATGNRDPGVNAELIRRKIAGELPASTDFLRFPWHRHEWR